MPRFFFDLYNDMDAPDREGQELPDLRAAQMHALKEARTMIGASVLEHGKIDLRHFIRVRDERGKAVHLVEFGDAVTIERGGEPV
jgi:hypothetical protein